MFLALFRPVGLPFVCCHCCTPAVGGLPQGLNCLSLVDPLESTFRLVPSPIIRLADSEGFPKAPTGGAAMNLTGNITLCARSDLDPSVRLVSMYCMRSG